MALPPINVGSDEWRRATELGLTKPRSSELKALDQALQNYHLQGKADSAFPALWQAMDNWKRAQQTKSPTRDANAFEKSERNRGGIIQRLNEAIKIAENVRKTQVDKDGGGDARKAIIEAEQKALITLFSGRTLNFKDKLKVEEASKLRKIIEGSAAIRKVGMVVNKFPGSPSAKDAVREAATTILGEAPSMVFGEIGIPWDSVATAVGNIFSEALAPAVLLKNVVVAGQQLYNRISASRARYDFRSGNADGALNGVISMINTELMVSGKNVTQNVASMLVGAFSAGTASTVLSAANSAVDLMVSLALKRKMREEMKAGNLLLMQNKLDLNVFNASPVLGCYYLLMADTSMILNFSVHDIGQAGWMDRIEMMKKRVQPTLDKARELIRTSDIALSGTEGFNGLEWEPSWRNNKIEYMSKMMNNPGQSAEALLKKLGG